MRGSAGIYLSQLSGFGQTLQLPARCVGSLKLPFSANNCKEESMSRSIVTAVANAVAQRRLICIDVGLLLPLRLRAKSQPAGCHY